MIIFRTGSPYASKKENIDQSTIKKRAPILWDFFSCIKDARKKLKRFDDMCSGTENSENALPWLGRFTFLLRKHELDDASIGMINLDSVSLANKNYTSVLSEDSLVVYNSHLKYRKKTKEKIVFLLVSDIDLPGGYMFQKVTEATPSDVVFAREFAVFSGFLKVSLNKKVNVSDHAVFFINAKSLMDPSIKTDAVVVYHSSKEGLSYKIQHAILLAAKQGYEELVIRVPYDSSGSSYVPLIRALHHLPKMQMKIRLMLTSEAVKERWKAAWKEYEVSEGIAKESLEPIDETSKSTNKTKGKRKISQQSSKSSNSKQM